MLNTPRDVLIKEHSKHNLHEVAWQPVLENKETTLEYFMKDYIGHVKHYLKQIL